MVFVFVLTAPVPSELVALTRQYFVLPLSLAVYVAWYDVTLPSVASVLQVELSAASSTVYADMVRPLSPAAFHAKSTREPATAVDVNPVTWSGMSPAVAETILESALQPNEL